MTTRNGQTPNLYGESESLDELAGEDAITLFLKACDISEADFQDRREVATKVADLLGQHALALIQAGIYVSSGLCSLEELPTFFQSNHNDILKHSKIRMQSRYSNVWTTLEASMETLQTSEDEVDIFAVNLLNISSFMNRQNVQEKFFESTLKNRQEERPDTRVEDDEISHLSVWHYEHTWTSRRFSEPSRTPYDMVKESPTVRKPSMMLFREARLRLAQLGILSFSPDGSTSMHPLVHLWARTRLQLHDQADPWVAAACTLAISAKQLQTQGSSLSSLSIHLESCFGFWSMNKSRYPLSLDIARILYAFCRHLLADHSPRATEIARVVSAWVKADPNATHNTVEHVMRLEGECLCDVGQHQLAVPLFQQVLEMQMKRLGSHDPALLVSRHHLADAYGGMGEHHRAIALLEEVVEMGTKTLGSDHRTCLTSQHQLASAYIEIGDHRQGIALLQQVVEIGSRVLKPEDSEHLTSLQKLARAYRDSDKHREAADILEEVVKIQSQTLEPEHPDLLASQYELAHVGLEISPDQHPEAEDVETESRMMKSEHPDRLASEDVLF